MMGNEIETKSGDASSRLKFIFMSLFGIFMFFVTFEFNGKSSIAIDHLSNLLKENVPLLVDIYVLIIVAFGAAYPFFKKTWNKDKITTFFSICKVLGIVFTVLVLFKIGPSWLMNPDMGPFLYKNLLVSVGILVPIGSIFLQFLVGYGLLEFFGVLMQPIMKPIFKTSGRSSLDAVASFVGSYSIGLLITNRVFKDGKYTVKEAVIIATGFSTVSATFMVVIAKNLGLMDIWNFYFWSTFVITFAVTALTVRIPPIRTKPNTYYKNQTGAAEEKYSGNLFKIALTEGLKATDKSAPLLTGIKDNLKDGLMMAANILPTGMTLALAGLVLSEYTPVFDFIGYIFFPIFKVFNIPEALLASKACALSIVECFIPTLLVTSSPLITKYIVGVVSVSAIIFFAATVPCILGTEIPVSIKDLVLIWLERVILTVIIAGIVAVLIF